MARSPSSTSSTSRVKTGGGAAVFPHLPPSRFIFAPFSYVRKRIQRWCWCHFQPEGQKKQKLANLCGCAANTEGKRAFVFGIKHNRCDYRITELYY